MISLPPSPGTYALILHLSHPAVLRIGRLGEFAFPHGFYIYLGGALGPGGLQARLGRHLSGSSRVHWHIDYLRSAAEVTGFCYLANPTHLECPWSQALSLSPGANIPVPGFGASDCRSRPKRCPAHLVAFGHSLHPTEIAAFLAQGTGLPVEAGVVPGSP
jgi:Uri superfamily endonuclease